MKGVILVLVVVASMAIAIDAKNITIHLDQDLGSLKHLGKHGFGNIKYYVDEDKTTIGELAEWFVKDKKVPEEQVDKNQLRCETIHGRKLPAEQTVAEAKLKDGDWLNVKWWSRIEDIGILGLRGVIGTAKFIYPGGGPHHYHSSGSYPSSRAHIAYDDY